MSAFMASLDRNILRVKKEINDKVYRISIELFLQIVSRTPSPTHRGKFAKGLLVNQWYPKAGKGFSNELGTSISPNGAASIARINALMGGNEFFNKDGRLSLSNNVHYAFQAEMLGWHPPKWSGRSGADGHGGPYRMVALSLQAIAGKYK